MSVAYPPVPPRRDLFETQKNDMERPRRSTLTIHNYGQHRFTPGTKGLMDFKRIYPNNK